MTEITFNQKKIKNKIPERTSIHQLVQFFKMNGYSENQLKSIKTFNKQSQVKEFNYETLQKNLDPEPIDNYNKIEFFYVDKLSSLQNFLNDLNVLNKCYEDLKSQRDSSCEFYHQNKLKNSQNAFLSFIHTSESFLTIYFDILSISQEIDILGISPNLSENELIISGASHLIKQESENSKKQISWKDLLHNHENQFLDFFKKILKEKEEDNQANLMDILSFEFDILLEKWICLYQAALKLSHS
jgi:hypothetical protein